MALMPLQTRKPRRTARTYTDRRKKSGTAWRRDLHAVLIYTWKRQASETNTHSAQRAQKEGRNTDMKNTKKTAQKEANTQKKNTAQKEGRKEAMKKTATFDINAHNNARIIEHMDGSRETITAEDMKMKNAARYNAEKVAQLRKWATARGIADADSMKKSALVAALVEDDAKPKEEKEAAKKAHKEAVTAKNAEAKKEAAAPKKNAQKKEKKEAAQKPKKDTKKKEDAPKMDSVKTSLEKEDARITCAMDVQNMQNTDIADALNRIKTLKLYEAKGADNMADFVNNKCATDEDRREGKKGKYHGMSYSHVNKYINAHNYVYSMKEEDGSITFECYGWHLIQALIAPCRHHSEEVREAVKDGKITASMSLKSLNELIDAEGWKKEKKEAADGAQKTDAEAEAAKDATAEAVEEMPKAEKHNGVTEEEAEDAAAVLSTFIEEAKISEAKKRIAQKALDILMKRADI